MYYIIIVGAAGSGKSTFTSALSEWMEDQQLSVVKVNLDPAAEWTPYTPDVDVREYVNSRDVMRKFNLGPNAALIASVDLLVEHTREIREEIENFKYNYAIIDTPGQLELFAMRPSGPVILRDIIGENKAVTVYLIDSFFAEKPSSFVSALLLAASTNIRLGIPQVNVVSKIDLLGPESIEMLRQVSSEPESLRDLLWEEHGSSQLIDVTYRLLDAIIETGMCSDLILASAYTNEGIDAVYAQVQQVLAGGEDFLTEEPSGRL